MLSWHERWNKIKNKIKNAIESVDDIGLAIATGGAYSTGQFLGEFGEAAERAKAAGESVEDFADSAGLFLAIISSVFVKLAEDLSPLLTEAKDILSIQRVTPRQEEELWDEELARLKSLKKKLQELLDEILQNQGDILEVIESVSSLAVVTAQINEILYQEPGILPATLYTLKQVLERFNIIEQPRLGDTIDLLNGNLEVSEDILKEVKKLLVIHFWKTIPPSDLSEEQQKKLGILQVKLANLDELIEKQVSIAAKLLKFMIRVQPEQFSLEKIIKVSYPQNAVVPSSELSTVVTDKLSEEETSSEAPSLIAESTTSSATEPMLKLRARSAMAVQPAAASIASVLNENTVVGLLSNYHAIEGRLHYYMRERIKVQKEIYLIQYILVEEPGVIPKILQRIRGILRFLDSFLVKAGVVVVGTLVLFILFMKAILLYKEILGI